MTDSVALKPAIQLSFADCGRAPAKRWSRRSSNARLAARNEDQLAAPLRGDGLVGENLALHVALISVAEAAAGAQLPPARTSEGPRPSGTVSVLSITCDAAAKPDLLHD